MIGPVLHLELLLGSRRGRLDLFRRVYAGWLIVQFYWLYYEDMFAIARGVDRPNFVYGYVELFLWQQFVLLLLVAPAFVAGVVTDEKSRGTLQYLLTTSLTSWEIVIGKLLGRIAQLGLLALTGLPLLCLVGTYADLGLVKLLGIIGTTAALLLGLGAVSLLTSVWCRNTRDAVLTLYALGALGYLLISQSAALRVWLRGVSWLPAWALWGADGMVRALNYFDPLYVVEPIWQPTALPTELTRRLVGAMLTWAGVGGACIALAAWRLRAAYVRQLEAQGKKRPQRWWRAQRARVADEPIRWKERHVEGIAPLAALRAIPAWAGVGAIIALTIYLPDWRLMTEAHARWLSTCVILTAGVVVGIRCSGTVTGERERQTWEALMLTPLTIPELERFQHKCSGGSAYPQWRK